MIKQLGLICYRDPHIYYINNIKIALKENDKTITIRLMKDNKRVTEEAKSTNNS